MIENGTKFLGVDASVPTPEVRSSQVNAASSMVTIEEIAEKVGNINNSAYTETIVDISSAQILAIGTTPIALLPAPGVGKYYDIENVTFEYSVGATPYSITSQSVIVSAYASSSINIASISQSILGSQNQVGFGAINPNVDVVNIGAGEFITIPKGTVIALNSAVELKGLTNLGVANSPTLGDGTLRVKIYHNTITFGA
jgi:hypothetical protein